MLGLALRARHGGGRPVDGVDEKRLRDPRVLTTIHGRPDLYRDVAEERDLGDVLLEDQAEARATAQVLHRVAELGTQCRLFHLPDQVVELGHCMPAFQSKER